MLIDDKQAREIAEVVAALRWIDPAISPNKAALTMANGARLLESLSAQVAELRKMLEHSFALVDDDDECEDCGRIRKYLAAAAAAKESGP